MRKFATLAVLAAFAFATVAGADDEPKKKKGGKRGAPNPEAAYKKADKNGDGKLTLDEFKDSLPEGKARDNAQKAFDRMDADHSGDVSLAEFKTFQEERAKKAKEKGKGKGGERKGGEGKGEGKGGEGKGEGKPSP